MPVRFIFFRFIGYGQIMIYQAGGWEGANFGALFFSSKFDFSTGNYENMQKSFPSCFFFLLFLALDTLLLTF